MSNTEKHTPFPVGGSRQRVYNFLQGRGWMMSNWSDKHWNRADGLKLHVYGAGSMARIYDKDNKLIVDGALDAAIIALAKGAS